MKRFKKWTVLFLTAVMVFTGVAVMPMDAEAKKKENHWYDGDTPEEYDNVVETSWGLELTPTVVTNFHAPSVKALVPSSTKAEFDRESGVAVSIYDDAKTVVFADDNGGYGERAEAVLNSALQATSSQKAAVITLNLMKYEGKCYKMVETTTNDLEFKIAIPDSIRKNNNTRDFAMIRINADGSVSYLPDLDDDPYVLTFKTNYFMAYNVYCLAYGPQGAFDAYRPVVTTLPQQ